MQHLFIKQKVSTSMKDCEIFLYVDTKTDHGIKIVKKNNESPTLSLFTAAAGTGQRLFNESIAGKENRERIYFTDEEYEQINKAWFFAERKKYE